MLCSPCRKPRAESIQLRAASDLPFFTFNFRPSTSLSLLMQTKTYRWPLGAAPFSVLKGCGFRFNLTHPVPKSHHVVRIPCTGAAPLRPRSALRNPHRHLLFPFNFQLSTIDLFSPESTVTPSPSSAQSSSHTPRPQKSHSHKSPAYARYPHPVPLNPPAPPPPQSHTPPPSPSSD
jgi:hypothetical protein